jgi:hypothetical protein
MSALLISVNVQPSRADDWQPPIAQSPVSSSPPEPAATLPAPPVSGSQRQIDDWQLNAFAVEFQNVDLEDGHAPGTLRNLEAQVEAFHQSLFQRNYNAMDILKGAEDLEHRIAEQSQKFAAKKEFGVGGASAEDPPGRVGRLSYIEGTVSLYLADQTNWFPATLNYPVTSGESFWTEPNARAEIQIGPIELRLDQTSELEVLRLDDTTIEVRLDQGTLYLHLWQMPQGGISVLTPRGRVVLTALGSYDIDAGRPIGDMPADRVQVTVLEGEARFEGEPGAIVIGHSEAAVISGEPMSVTLTAATYSPFDDWALARERREVAAQQPKYVAPAVTGYQDLYEYGGWNYDPNYGSVWYPTAVPRGWAPYRYGHWAFVAPWGWTWIDDAPWGFTPFHYGRWVETGGRWGWCPGNLVERPVYAPALVVFIGGDGWGISPEFGAAMAAVGWVALAPNEVYHPYYRASPTYVRDVNITNVNRTLINNITINNNANAKVSNFRNRQAATVVPATAFTHASPVQHATVVVSQSQLAQVSVATSTTHLRPTAAARIGRAVPAATASTVAQPNAPATIVRTRVDVLPPASETEPVPNAPGPRNSGTHRDAISPPAATARVVPQGPPIQTQTVPATSAHGGALSELQAPHPTTHNETVQRRPEPIPSPTAHGPRIEIAPPRVSPSTPPSVVAAPAGHQPPAQIVHAPPAIQVTRPEQETHVVPTPHAWTRVPGPPPQSARMPAPDAAAAASHPVQPSQPAKGALRSGNAPPRKERSGKDENPEQQ